MDKYEYLINSDEETQGVKQLACGHSSRKQQNKDST